MPRHTKTVLEKGTVHACLALPNNSIWGISVQGSYCGGYRGTTFDGRCGMGIFLSRFSSVFAGAMDGPRAITGLFWMVFLDLDFQTKGT